MITELLGSQNTQWNAPRVGLSAETMLTERWRLSAGVAYLLWTDFKGRDNHLLRPTTTFAEQRGNRVGGVQIGGALCYFITKNYFSVGVGGRYWAMWTKKDSIAPLDDVGINLDAGLGNEARQPVPTRQRISNGLREFGLLAEQTKLGAQPGLRERPDERPQECAFDAQRSRGDGAERSRGRVDPGRRG